MSDLPKGIIVKKPHDKAPDFVIADISFKTDEAIETLESNDKNGWSNYQIKRSKAGSYYISVNDYNKGDKPHEPENSDVKSGGHNPEDDDLPF